MSTQVLARKWRPHNFPTMVGQQHVVKALTNAINQQRLHHAYLFTGTRGVGKTTTARILAKCLNCETGITAEPCEQCDTCTEINTGRCVDLFEVDAASRTKVEDTRDLLDNVQYAPAKARYKIYLIDEVHMLSGHSFNALLKTLEEPPEHVKFLLATTDPQKLPATVLSRCLQFHMKNLTIEQIAGHLQHILQEEQFQFEAKALERLGRGANGSMRDALSLLDQSIAYGDSNITLDAVNNMLGALDHNSLVPLLDALIALDAQAILDAIQQLAEQGADFTSILEEVLSLMHQITIMQALPAGGERFVENSELALRFAGQLRAETLQLYYQIALIGRRDLPLAPTPKSGFEMLMLRMLAFTPNSSNNQQSTQKQSAAVGTQQPAHRQPAAQPARAQTTSSAGPQASTQPTTATQTPAKAAIPSAPKAPPTDSKDWNIILTNLDLKGPSFAVAQHCALLSLSDNEMVLQIEKKHAIMLNKNLEKRLSDSICSYYNKPIKLVVNVVDDSIEATPAAHSAKIAAAKQTAAESNIQNDGNIKEIVDTFNATILPDSIESVS